MLAILALVTALGASEPREHVQAKGSAPLTGSHSTDGRAAKDAALRDAVRSTVTKWTNEATAEAFTAALSIEEIYSFVFEYRVRNERPRRDTFEVELEASIKRNTLVRELVKRAPEDRKSDVIVLIAVEQAEYSRTTPPEERVNVPGPNTVETVMTEALLRHGVRVVSVPDDILEKSRIALELRLENAKRLGATAAIGGTITSLTTGTVMGTHLHHVSAVGRFMVNAVHDIDVLAALGEIRDFGTHISEGVASSRAINKVAENAADQLLLKLLYTSRKPAPPPEPVESAGAADSAGVAEPAP